MKSFGIFLLALVLSLSSNGQEIITQKDSISYAAGMIIAQRLINEGMTDLNKDLLLKALEEGLYTETKMDLDEANLYYKIGIKKAKEIKMEQNRIAGEEFLNENTKKDGVVTLPSGLQYEVITAGEGLQPNPGDKVKTHYHGTLIDGRVFDSSVQRGKPISFPLNAVIQAWQEALPLMKVGSKWRIFSPYNLAYGTRGTGPLIGPYSALIFEIELLAIE